ncbi:cysteine desulfurase [bacterium]|jgi:cysteine desulfurase|nr:cysteine desulfurase [bacterium]
MKPIYFDNAATTPVLESSLNKLKGWAKIYGNPSSQHQFGQNAREIVEAARYTVAKTLNVDDDSIIFTSSGTESNTLALHGVFLPYITKNEPAHLLISAIEHASVRQTATYLSTCGIDVEEIPVTSSGIVDTSQLELMIKPHTKLVSIQTINNEIGTLQPINEIGTICQAKNILFHTDAVQAFLKIDLDMKQLPIDLLSMSAHKCYAPKGTGALFIKDKTKILPQLKGGPQEIGMRAGTQNTLGIRCFQESIETLSKSKDEFKTHIRELDTYFLQKLSKVKQPHHLLGGDSRAPGFLNISFPHILSEDMVMHLDINNIAISAGSACSTGSLEPSHVLKAINLPKEIIHSAVRISLGIKNTKEEIDLFFSVLSKFL